MISKKKTPIIKSSIIPIVSVLLIGAWFVTLSIGKPDCPIDSGGVLEYAYLKENYYPLLNYTNILFNNYKEERNESMKSVSYCQNLLNNMSERYYNLMDTATEERIAESELVKSMFNTQDCEDYVNTQIKLSCTKSMHPTFDCTDILTTCTPIRSRLKVGDIIGFKSPDFPEFDFVIHRIIAVTSEDCFITQGDSNLIQDSYCPNREDVLFKVIKIEYN